MTKSINKMNSILEYTNQEQLYAILIEQVAIHLSE